MKCHYSQECFLEGSSPKSEFQNLLLPEWPPKNFDCFFSSSRHSNEGSNTFLRNFHQFFFFSFSVRILFGLGPDLFFFSRIFYSRGFPSGPGMSIMIFLGCLQSLFFLFKAHHFFLLSRSRDVAASLSKQCLAWTVSNRDLGTNS